MVATVTHSKVSTIPPTPDPDLVSSTDWNDGHVIDIDAAGVPADSSTLVGTGTNVQAVLEELDNGVADHLADTSAAHAASAVSVDSSTLVGVGTTAQAVFEELDNGIADHLADTTAAHAASAISADSSTLVGVGTDVQGVLEELDNGIADHLADTSAAHAASAISASSTTLVGVATDVQGVLEELDDGIANHLADTSDAHAIGSITDGVSGKNGGLESVSAIGNTGTAKTIDLTAGNVITFTVNGNCTFTMPSGLTSGKSISFTVILTDSGGPRNITFTGVKWSGGTDPTAMSAASAIDIYSFLTIDGGTTWYGFKGGTGMAV